MPICKRCGEWMIEDEDICQTCWNEEDHEDFDDDLDDELTY